MESRIIAHLDMDAFFASVEEKDRPWLKGLPIVVGSDPEDGDGRGVVAAANYAAREYGIYSATPIRKAWLLSESARKRGEPRVSFVVPRHNKYGVISKRIMTIIESYASVVQKRSIDEAYFDLSYIGSYKNAKRHVEKLQREIKQKEKLSCSIGIGPNKMIAKMASDFKKPYGITVITQEELKDFLAPLPVTKIQGVGPKTAEKLHRANINTISDLRDFSKEKLIELFGKHGASLWNRARGIDESELVINQEVKSIGEQETFGEDTLVMKTLFARLDAISQRVHERFSGKKFSGFKTVVLTVRFADFETMSRSQTLKESTNSLERLEWQARRLFMPFLDKRENPKHKKIRLLGVRIEKLN